MLELQIGRLITGTYRLRLKGRKRSFFFVEPKATHRLLADEYYQKCFDKNIRAGVLTNSQSIDEMIAVGAWTKEKEKYLEDVEKDIAHLKTLLYKKRKDALTLKTVRARLDIAKETFSQKSRERSFLFANTAEASANSARLSFLVGYGLQQPLGRRVWRGNSFWRDNDTLLNEAALAYINEKPDMPLIRKMARSDYWRTIWAAKCACPDVFGRSSMDLSDDQKSLVAWTRFYENAREDSEPPEDFVVEDDDMFDGWIQLRTENNSNKEGSELTGYIDQKIASMDHVFISGQAVAMANGATLEEAIDREHTPETIEKVYNIGGQNNAARAAAKLAAADKAGEKGIKEIRGK